MIRLRLRDAPLDISVMVYIFSDDIHDLSKIFCSVYPGHVCHVITARFVGDEITCASDQAVDKPWFLPYRSPCGPNSVPFVSISGRCYSICCV